MKKGTTGWDGWMASPTQWTWVCVNSGSWQWIGRPGMLQFMGSQRVGCDWATEMNWTELNWVMILSKGNFFLFSSTWLKSFFLVDWGNMKAVGSHLFHDHHQTTGLAQDSSWDNLRIPSSEPHGWACHWLSSKESASQARDAGLVPRLGRSPREGNGSPLQYFCLGNPADRGAWQATGHGFTKSHKWLKD